MKKVEAQVTFKTKIKEFADGEKYIDYKKTFSRSDCNLKAHQHDYYNSDLFPSMLNKAVQTAINNRRWERIADLPETVTCSDFNAFMPVFTIKIVV